MGEYKTQALDYLAQSNALRRNFTDASDIWETLLSAARTSLERAYLFHELGRCYMEMNKMDVAKHYVTQTLEEAYKIDDHVWLMNGLIFMAQIERELLSLIPMLDTPCVSSAAYCGSHNSG